MCHSIAGRRREFFCSQIFFFDIILRIYVFLHMLMVYVQLKTLIDAIKTVATN